MISLVEAMKTSTEDLPQIYCDMDGVLCDFIRGANNAVGGIFATADRKTRWDKIVSGGSKFWSDLEWMSGGKKLYQFIARYNPKILSAYSDKMAASSKKGKLQWLQKLTNIKKKDTNLVLRDQKKRFAVTKDRPNILIDDYEKNIKEWESAGGIGILHINTVKTLSELKRQGFK
jgi:hypothetical protein|tara:strand:- start:2188 stop:2709 length:522 start_codon:yes stop_codon:yes gene_type:complete